MSGEELKHSHSCQCGNDHEREGGDDEGDREFNDGPLTELITVRDWLRYAVTRFNRAGIFCGHGVDNSYDEAVWLILATLALPPERLEPFLDACIPGDERPALYKNIEYRASERIPTAYLVNEAWLSGYRFYVDERVIVPRSYFAELLEDDLAPWVENPEKLTDVLDLCTGSGCLAVLLADAFSNANIVAADLSPEALAVAQRNVSDYGLDERVELVQSDVFDALDGRLFDLIVCNPPYVTAKAMAALPPEYRHEPMLALSAGEDGLAVVRRLLAGAANHLKPGGILMVEVGHNARLVENVRPDLSLTWLSTRDGVDGVFLLRREDLPDLPDAAANPEA
ncbi:MAG: 50S ribosomal protein L3 N(5)-glutamine methyltransferase [Azoarcus sp.]|jgi:ribosomal protein L3 glutamine methyltransferase|nr:50S ribosomal protein L3 N(5)-glutamine methyltransferase [Azoarcus sp.]